MLYSKLNMDPRLESSIPFDRLAFREFSSTLDRRLASFKQLFESENNFPPLLELLDGSLEFSVDKEPLSLECVGSDEAILDKVGHRHGPYPKSEKVFNLVVVDLWLFKGGLSFVAPGDRECPENPFYDNEYRVILRPEGQVDMIQKTHIDVRLVPEELSRVPRHILTPNDCWSLFNLFNSTSEDDDAMQLVLLDEMEKQLDC